MKIPESMVRAGKQALQSRWDDRAQVTRQVKGTNTFVDQVIYDDLPCHLSVSISPALTQTGNEARADPAYTLYLDTDADIHPGDTLTVSHRGQTEQADAGIPFRRNFSLVLPLKGVVIA